MIKLNFLPKRQIQFNVKHTIQSSQKVIKKTISTFRKKKTKTIRAFRNVTHQSNRNQTKTQIYTYIKCACNEHRKTNPIYTHSIHSGDFTH